MSQTSHNTGNNSMKLLLFYGQMAASVFIILELSKKVHKSSVLQNSITDEIYGLNKNFKLI
jgi:hypothetical protein